MSHLLVVYYRYYYNTSSSPSAIRPLRCSVVAVPRIRRPLRIAQHVIKALLPWLFPAHQIFERARYSASKLFHFDSYSRNSCSDAARESIALNNDVIEDCAALSFSRSFPAPNLGSDVEALQCLAQLRPLVAEDTPIGLAHLRYRASRPRAGCQARQGHPPCRQSR